MLPADGMLDPTNKDSTDLPLTIRAVFIIGPDKKLKLSLNCEDLLIYYVIYYMITTDLSFLQIWNSSLERWLHLWSLLLAWASKMKLILALDLNFQNCILVLLELRFNISGFDIWIWEIWQCKHGKLQYLTSALQLWLTRLHSESSTNREFGCRSCQCGPQYGKRGGSTLIQSAWLL